MRVLRQAGKEDGLLGKGVLIIGISPAAGGWLRDWNMRKVHFPYAAHINEIIWQELQDAERDTDHPA